MGNGRQRLLSSYERWDRETLMETRMSARRELHRLVDELPEAETQAAKRYLQYLRDRRLPGLKALLEAPEEDRELTIAAMERIQERIREAEAGETVPHDEVLRKLGG